ncbi:3'-5' exonuclease [Batrachochytrium dendrobatidis]|nr:3'-5' exonuclease [Batrachochytrium dendrobatidis]
MVKLSSNWKALSKILKKKQPVANTAKVQHTDSKPNHSAIEAKTVDDLKLEPVKPLIPETATCTSKPNETRLNAELIFDHTVQNETSDTIKMHMDILNKIMDSGESLLGLPSDDEADDGSTAKPAIRKRKHVPVPSQKSQVKENSRVYANETDAVNQGTGKRQKMESKTAKEEIYGQTKIGKYVAIDCEMVGVGLKGSQSMLARVSIVNYHGHVILDEFVLPEEDVTDYRTKYSGIRPALLKSKGRAFKEVQQKVADILKDRIVIGHAVKHDFEALMLTHPSRSIRDTSTYKPFRNPKTNSIQSLKKLAAEYLGLSIQNNEHSSVEDAQATMKLYHLHRADWERQLQRA